MSSSVCDPWTTDHVASPSTPDMRKQRRTWHAATPHKINSPDNATPCLKITHFTKKVIVCFDVVKVGKTKRRTLKLVNPHNYPQLVELERISPKKGFFLEDKYWEIQPQDTLNIPIFWTPPDDGSFRDLITFLCDGTFRLQVILLGTAEETTKRGSGRRSTFLVKRQSASKPLRPNNTNGLKTTRQSLVATSNCSGKENKVDQKSLGKQLHNTKTREVESDRGTSLAVKTNKHVIGRSQVVDKSRCLKRLVQPQEIEVYFDEKTTSEVLKELSGAVEPIKNVAVENVARETLLVCEGMSPLLKFKKFDRTAQVTSPYGSPSHENEMKILKGTEIKTHQSEGVSSSSLPKLSKRALFTDTENSDASEMQQSILSNVADVNITDTSDHITDDSLEAGDDVTGSGNASVDGVVVNTVPYSANADYIVDGVVGDISVNTQQAIADDVFVFSTENASDNVHGVVDDITVTTQQAVDDIGRYTVCKTVKAYYGITTDTAGDARVNVEDILDLSQRNLNEMKSNREDCEQVLIPAVGGGECLESGACNLEGPTAEVENVERPDKTEAEKNITLPLDWNERARKEVTEDLTKIFEVGGEKRKQDEGETENQKDVILMTQGDKTQGVENPASNEYAVVGKSQIDVSGDSIKQEDAPPNAEKEDKLAIVGRAEEEVDKKGLIFIPLNQDISQEQTGVNGYGYKRVIEDIREDVKGTKKPRLSVAGDKSAGKGKKGSFSLNRTVALRRAAATNSSVSAAPKTRPKVKKLAKGVPMAKLNLVKPAKTALPRHPMPFAAKNMFYDERWVDKQERGFVQWLNFVLTPEDAASRNPSIKGTKIEASALAVSSSSTSIKPAPTKEALSLRAYTAKRCLNQLRRASCLLFQSEPVVRVIQKLEALVENRGLTVRSDRKIHADLGMKQNILMMILCYNPLWLRIGLETIYGELLPVEDNSDIVGLSRFIVTRLLGNPDIAALYAHPTVPALYRPGYEETLAKFTLKKFLLLVFFLDRAKLTRLIDHDPCLFCKDAQYKSSRDLLLEFSRLYLKGEGDITRHLNYIGYSVTHAQKALDEYDFGVVNLAKDLRDGVRLVRVTELLTKNWMLSHELRCPAISRLQKIHNVQVALQALRQNVNMSGCGVDAKSIVEGHREKTLQLLWNIIFSFKVETILDETQLKEETEFLWNNLKLKRKLDAVKILSSYKSAGHGQVDTNVYFKSDKLSLLLKWCQAVCAYYSIQVENFTVSFCDGRVLCYLVHHYHPELIPLSVINNITTQTENLDETKEGSENDSFDGTWARSYNPTAGKDLSIDHLLKNEQQNFKTLYQAIQNLGGVPFMVKSMDMSGTIPDEKVVITYTSYLCARLLDLCHETRAVRIIQMAWRNYQLRKQTEYLKALNKAAIVIQQRVKQHLRKRYLQKRIEAVICLQTAVRGWMARRELLVLRRNKRQRDEDAAAVILQSHFKRLKAQRLYSNQLRSVVKLQAMIRGRRVRQDVMKMKQAVLLIEDYYTAHKKKNEMLQKYRETRKAIITIQALFRGLKARKLCREVKAAKLIQVSWKSYMWRKRYQSMKVATVLIQSVWRMHLKRKRYTEMKLAARQIQDWYRSIQLKNRERLLFLVKYDAVRQIQACYRGWKARKMYARQRNSCILIQATFRSYLTRKEYQHLRLVTIRLQRRYRADLQAQQESERYKGLKRATTVIQACLRGWLVRKQLQKKKQAAILIQAHVRGFVQRKAYSTIRQACVTLQRSIRCYQQRQQYLALRQSVLLTQRVFRGQMARRQIKAVRSAIKIQATYRMYKARSQYKAEVTAVISCQAAVRCFITHRRFERLLAATKVIQKHVRGWLLMQKTKAEYCQIKSACTIIQSAYRGHVIRRQYMSIRSNIILCQSIARSFLKRKRYQKQRHAAIILQRRYRALQEGRICRATYQQQKHGCIVLQTSFRKYVCRRRYLAMKSAAVTLQSYWRMMIVRKRYQTVLGACITIQKRWKEVLVARQQREAYQEALNKAAIVIQQRVKQHLRKRYLQKRVEAVICIQTAVRGWMARRELLVLRRNKRQRDEDAAAVILQSHFKRLKAQRLYSNQLRSVVKLQAMIRGRRVRQDVMKMKQAVLLIEDYYTAHKKKNEMLQKCRETRKAIITIQALFRGLKARKLYREVKAAKLIQVSWKSYKWRKRYQSMKVATVLIQSVWRMHLKRKRYTEMKLAARQIQDWYRSIQLKNRERLLFLVKYDAVRQIQACYRGWKARKMYARQRNSCILIQATFRSYLTRKEYQHLRLVTIRLQRRYRANLQAQQESERYKDLKRATTVIQACLRGWLVRKQLQKKNQAAILIQAHVRGFVQRKAYSTIRQACVTLQHSVRCYQQRQQYLALRQSVLLTQRVFRGQMARRQIKPVRSAIKIQATYRMYKARSQYKAEVTAVISCQAAVRCFITHRRFERLLAATKVIQKHVRGWLQMQKTKAEYCQIKSACTIIQSAYRGHVIRRQYMSIRSNIILCQSIARSFLKRKRYQKQRHAAIILQRRYRARQEGRICRATYQQQKHGCIVLQTSFRKYVCRRRYLAMKSAAVTLQSYWRMMIVRKRYQTVLGACITIQKRWKEVLVARQQREAYQEALNKAAIVIQQRVKQHLRKRYLQKRIEAVICLQTAVRGWMARRELLVLRRHKRQRDEDAAAVILQTWTRSRLQRLRYVHLLQTTLLAQRLYKKRHQQRVTAVMVLQSYCRMWLAKRRLHRMQSAAITLQSIWRGRKVRVSIKSKKVARARDRCMKACKAATEDNKLCNRTTSGLNFLLTYKHLHQVVEAVSSLEVATRLSARCCERLVAGQAVPVLFRLIKNCNRSLPCMEVIKYVVATLVNLAKYAPTAPSVLECSSAVTGILDLMMIYRETSPVIFTKAAMLLTVLAQEENLKKILLATPKIGDNLRSLLNLQERKLKLKTRQMIAKSKCQGIPVTQSQLMTPSKNKKPVRGFKPDWVLERYKRQDLEDPIEVLRFLMGALNMKC